MGSNKRFVKSLKFYEEGPLKNLKLMGVVAAFRVLGLRGRAALRILSLEGVVTGPIETKCLMNVNALHLHLWSLQISLLKNLSIKGER